MTSSIAYTGARIFDGTQWFDNSALLVVDENVESILPLNEVPADAQRQPLDGGLLVPGFIDLQVNGGGGTLLNEDPTIRGLRTICDAHVRFGTTALLPTLITDTPEVTAKALAAGRDAVGSVQGFIGLHLEGPHLSIARKGAHDPKLIRSMEESDLAALIAAREDIPNILSTVAAETVTPAQIARLVEAGIVVSLGHSEGSFSQAEAAAEAGASMATHLFNAMSQLGNREPGIVGAVLEIGSLYAGLIADGIHVHPATMGAALRAKKGPGKIFLVTDAMSLTGTDLPSLMLNGREIRRADGALRLADGTLAGADLTMIDAVRYMHERIALPLEEALRMASLYPAEAMDIAGRYGHLHQGAWANFLHLSGDLAVRGTWIHGNQAFRA